MSLSTIGTLTAPTELTPLTLDDSAIFKWTLPSGWDHIQSSSHFPQYSILINCTLTTAPYTSVVLPKLNVVPGKSLTDYTAYGQLGSVKSWNFTPGTWNVNVQPTCDWTMEQINKYCPFDKNPSGCRPCSGFFPRPAVGKIKITGDTDSSSTAATVTGEATKYSQCTTLLQKGNEACKVFPQYSPDPSALVRYNCINANVEVGDKCFSTVTPTGDTTYTWTFNYPPRPKIRAAFKDAKTASANDTATTYKKCRELLMLGNQECEKFPEWTENPDEPLKHKCIDANVAVADKCFAKVNPEGTATYTYDFVYPAATSKRAFSEDNDD